MANDEPAEPSATVVELAEQIKILAANFGRTKLSDEDGKLMFTSFVFALQGISRSALEKMVQSIILEPTREFMPRPGYCRAKALEFVKPHVSVRIKAFIGKRATQLMNEWLDGFEQNLHSQDDVDRQDEHWRKIAEEKGYLRRVCHERGLWRYEIRKIIA